MSHTSVRPGSMTTAMSAVTRVAPKVLRVGVVSGGAVVDERIIRDRQVVTAGPTERCTLSVREEIVPSAIELFVPYEDRFALVLHPSAELRIATADGPRTLDALRAEKRITTVNGRELLALDVTDRGKLTLGDVIVLFQFVNAPPVAPRAQLPASLKSSYARTADWRYNACLAAFMALGMTGLGYVEYLYDPVVPSDSDISASIARLVRMEAQPPSDPTEPAPPTDPSDAPPTAPAAATTAPNTHAPSHAPAPHSTGPAPTNAERAMRDAQRIVNDQTHGMDAVFAPLTSVTDNGHSARDLLANNGAIGLNAERDLANTHGISTEPSTVNNNRIMGSNVIGPPGTLTGTRLRADGPGPGPLGPTEERRITTVLAVRLTDEPMHQTCDEDASAVARSFRINLGGLRSCYERGVRNDPTLRGRVSVSFTLGASGRATSVQANGLGSEVDACLAGAVRRIVFTQLTCGSADFTFPVNFDQGAR